MSFLGRIAKAAARSAPQELEAAQGADPFADPPPGHRGRDRRPIAAASVQSDPQPRKAPTPKRWPEDIAGLVKRLPGLEAGDLPQAPFKLQPWTTITNAAVWLESIQREVERGTSSARARMGTLQDDLRFLELRMRDQEPTAEELEAARFGASFAGET